MLRLLSYLRPSQLHRHQAFQEDRVQTIRPECGTELFCGIWETAYYHCGGDG